MAIQFPANPTTGDIYQDPTTGEAWQWDGTKWVGLSNEEALWERNGTIISPATAGDDITTTGDVTGANVPNVPGNGTITINEGGNQAGQFTVNQTGNTTINLTGGGGPGAVPTGAIFYFAAVTPPAGYLACDGTAISRTTFAELFAVTGTTFGPGDGATTFNLPNLLGQFIRGWDDGRGLDPGRAFGTDQIDATALPNTPFNTNTTGNHSHSYSGGDRQIVGNGGQSQPVSQGGNNTGGAGNHSHSITGGDTETRPTNVALLPCIRA